MANPSGAKLEKIQTMLNEKVNPKPPLEVDGKWGKNTSKAIKLLQSKANIKQSGEVDQETAVVISRVIKTGKIEKEQPIFYIQHNGKTIGYTKNEYEKAKKSIIGKLRSGPLLEMQQASGAAKVTRDHFVEMEKDATMKFVAWCIEVTRRTDLPPKSLIDSAVAITKKMEGYLKTGNISKFHAEQPKAERITNIAIAKMDAYRKDMIDGGGNWVETLKWTKTGAFTFVGIFAAPVAAGALGTGALASAVIGGAAVAVTESAATEIGKGTAGTKNWTVGGAVSTVIIDTGVGAIIGVFNKGGKGGANMLEAAVSKVAPKMAAEQGFKTLSKETIKRFATYMMTEGAKNTTENAIKDAAKAAKGDTKMTMDKFTTNLASNFAKGAAFGPLGAVVGKYGKGAITKKFKTKIWDQALKELRKSSGGAIQLGDIDKRTVELVEKLVGDMMKAGVDKAVSDALDGLKGPMNAKKIDKEMEAQLFSPKQMKVYSAIALKESQKALKKKK